MKIAVPKERRPGEARVAASPDTVRKFVVMGHDVVVEAGAGAGARIADGEFVAAGATIAGDEARTLEAADIVLKVQRPLVAGEETDEVALMKSGALLISHLDALRHKDVAEVYAKAGIVAFALDLLPRISRAQAMDILSSQSNLAGYKAVLEAAAFYGRAFPMMMTAAGTVPPARVLVLGAGVAGLQAIATARRLGAVVHAFDVRPAVREQVESLGAKFVEVDAPGAESAGGYALEMSEDYKKKQERKIAETLQKTDIVIATALIPGKPAPVLVTEEMVASMRAGSVIVDLAVEAGGNCPLSEPGQVVEKHGVTLIGRADLPSRLATDASLLYARNVLNFFGLFHDPESKAFRIDWNDEIIKATALTRGGQVIHPALSG